MASKAADDPNTSKHHHLLAPEFFGNKPTSLFSSPPDPNATNKSVSQFIDVLLHGGPSHVLQMHNLIEISQLFREIGTIITHTL